LSFRIRHLAFWSVAVAILLCGSLLALAKPNASKLEQHAISVDARPIKTFTRSGTAPALFGKLRFLGGVTLKSQDQAFGGFSGIEISSDGSSIIAISDAGSWLRAKLVYDGQRLAGLTNAVVGPIMALEARRLSRGRDRDAESVRLLKGNLVSGTVLVSFELNHRIGFFSLTGGNLEPPQRYLRPPTGLGRNKGLEAVAVIKGGSRKNSIIAFAERSLDRNGHHRGWIWQNGKGKRREAVSPVALTNLRDFDVTDAVGSPDGSLFVLERRFRWSEGVKMRVRRIAADQIKPGAVLQGEVLFEADLGYEIDNMEGIALHQDKQGRAILTLISDDNFNSFLQRTILLQFEVVD
jgi:hypothetical protein